MVDMVWRPCSWVVATPPFLLLNLLSVTPYFYLVDGALDVFHVLSLPAVHKCAGANAAAGARRKAIRFNGLVENTPRSQSTLTRLPVHGHAVEHDPDGVGS